eukprot:TRINITY_DN8364_c0_g1_i1.p1 TRINITY_DN8364_c0_g1~~TRINITY_DN8364_c0_g1_i1.p1  ORF type:complete len:787 (-),score=118.37 TRINITY_DN8364_c0_g1_i1:74-2434(-)
MSNPGKRNNLVWGRHSRTSPAKRNVRHGQSNGMANQNPNGSGTNPVGLLLHPRTMPIPHNMQYQPSSQYSPQQFARRSPSGSSQGGALSNNGAAGNNTRNYYPGADNGSRGYSVPDEKYQYFPQPSQHAMYSAHMSYMDPRTRSPIKAQQHNSQEPAVHQNMRDLHSSAEAYNYSEDEEMININQLKRIEREKKKKKYKNGRKEIWHGLDLSGCGFLTLNKAVCNYTHLTMLLLNDNKLTSLPEKMFKALPLLSTLDISSNELSSLSPSIGQLLSLEILNLANNRLTSLPFEVGRLYHLKTLKVEGNSINNVSPAVLQQPAQRVIAHLRERLSLPDLPKRKWISFRTDTAEETPSKPKKSCEFRVLNYNILAQKYSLPDMCGHCPEKFLRWEHRKKHLLMDLLRHNCDFVSLQEMEAVHFYEYFLPKMREHGFNGVFKPKSRARTMDDWEASNVDGCALFYKEERFEILDEVLIEYQTESIERYEKEFSENREAFDRLITKDQIALVTVFRFRTESEIDEAQKRKQKLSGQQTADESTKSKQKKSESKTQEEKSGGEEEEKLLMVVNTHIYYDPAYADVKLMQTCILIEELQKLVLPDSALKKMKEKDDKRSSDTDSKKTKVPTSNYRNSKNRNEMRFAKVPLYARRMKSSTSKKPVMPVVICGDFNSLPASGVYEMLQSGKLQAHHKEFNKQEYGKYSSKGMKHNLGLQSAYSLMGNEPAFTNYTDSFVGTLDYIFYTQQYLTSTKVLQPVYEKDVLEQFGALPNGKMCSDHIPLVSHFEYLTKH